MSLWMFDFLQASLPVLGVGAAGFLAWVLVS